MVRRESMTWTGLFAHLRNVPINIFNFHSDCRVIEPEPEAKDEQVARQLWETSRTYVNLDPEYDPFQPETDV